MGNQSGFIYNQSDQKIRYILHKNPGASVKVHHAGAGVNFDPEENIRGDEEEKNIKESKEDLV